MTSITFRDRLTIKYVLVDDWYPAYGQKYRPRTAGRKPQFTDSEVNTLMLAQEYLPYPSAAQYLARFSKLLDQSQFNRRARSLHRQVEELRRCWQVQQAVFLLDTKPIAVVGYKRSKQRSDFLGQAQSEVFWLQTVLGFCTRVIAKITSHVLKHMLLADFIVKVQSFQALACSNFTSSVSY